MSIGDDLHPVEARKIAEAAFGRLFMLFRSHGIWYAGRYMHDDARRKDGGERPPWSRKQEVFGVGPTLREALRFATGASAIYSGAGMSPGGNPKRGTGYRPQWDELGRLIGFTSPAGIFSKAFPSATIVTA